MIVSAMSIGRQVSFPSFAAERVYMLPFLQRDGLPTGLRRWQRTIDAMLDGLKVPGQIYLMIDQAKVDAGTTHRRSGRHVDGNWLATSEFHGHITEGGEYAPETIILASNVQACRAYLGACQGRPSSDGDCCHIDVSGTKAITLRANQVYLGNATLVHESLPVPCDCKRTLVRLNIPNLQIAQGALRSVELEPTNRHPAPVGTSERYCTTEAGRCSCHSATKCGSGRESMSEFPSRRRDNEPSCKP